VVKKEKVNDEDKVEIEYVTETVVAPEGMEGVMKMLLSAEQLLAPRRTAEEEAASAARLKKERFLPFFFFFEEFFFLSQSCSFEARGAGGNQQAHQIVEI
jgi:hypothetical protein